MRVVDGQVVRRHGIVWGPPPPPGCVTSRAATRSWWPAGHS